MVAGQRCGGADQYRGPQLLVDPLCQGRRRPGAPALGLSHREILKVNLEDYDLFRALALGFPDREVIIRDS